MDPDQVEIEDADRRAEEAKASLKSRLHELERRFSATRERLDIGSKIAAHPRLAVGIAFGAGALLGLLGGSSRRAAPTAEVAERSISSAIFAALGAFAIQALKDLALREGTEMARGWWADRAERDASRDPSVEAFLEH